MVFTYFFTDIEWNICNHPNTAINKKTNSQLTNDELDIIFEIKTTSHKNTHHPPFQMSAEHDLLVRVVCPHS